MFYNTEIIVSFKSMYFLYNAVQIEDRDAND